MKRHKTFHEITLMKVFNAEDIKCLSCRSKFRVFITMEGTARWTLYRNPNADRIKKSLMKFMKFIHIRPDAVAFVNTHINNAICPCCSDKTLTISESGEYNKETLLGSLDA